MPLDPQARALLDQILETGFPPLNQMTVDEARQAVAAMGACHGEAAAVASAEDRNIPAADTTIAVRIYTPRGRAPFPLLLYFHGGGWVIGDLDTHDGVCRDIAHHAQCVVVSVDYRLAPEHKFPIPAEDAYAATCWAAANAAAIGADPTRIAVAGDSAGGNLAAVTAMLARDRGKPALRFQALIYPVTSAACDTVSYRENADGYFLTTEMMHWFWNHYLRSEADRDNPYASPLKVSEPRGLPPALVITAEFDPLRDEGEAYAARLRDAGVPVTTSRYDGMIHGFIGMGDMLPQGKQAIAEVSAALRSVFVG